MDYNANMNTVKMDTRHYPMGYVRPPNLLPHGMARQHPMPMGMRAPLGMGPPPLPPPMPTQNLYVEEHMDHLAGKLDMLENELRYAWRALDVLSQEYIKMWERLEKMEGLLTEQQTVITQLIDLYTVDSSDNADNSFDTDGGGSGKFSTFGGKDPDESFYKALNVVHRDSYPETAGHVTMTHFNTAKDEKSSKQGKSGKQKKRTESPSQASIKSKSSKQRKSESMQMSMREDSENDIKSMTSSVRSVSEMGEFPVGDDGSPSYENLNPGQGSLSSVMSQPMIKRKLPRVPPVPESRRTRKDGYVGEPEKEMRGQPPMDLYAQISKKSISKKLGHEPEKPKAESTEALQNQGMIPSLAEQKTQYDTFPKRKSKHKEQSDDQLAENSPLTVIDGTYSFSLSDDNVKNATQYQDNDEKTVIENLPVSKHSQERKESTLPTQNPLNNIILPKPGERYATHPEIGNSKELASQRNIEADKNSPSDVMSVKSNSIFQQIQSRESDTGLSKTRKMSLKEKRKLRTEQSELHLQKTIEEQSPMQAPIVNKPASSESDVSMRSDHSISPKRESGHLEYLDQGNGLFISEQQAATSNGSKSRNNGSINILPVQQQLLVNVKPSSREFAVSRALGKYRQKQKKERESFHGSSNSDSQEELDLQPESGLEGTIKSIDAKLANIEEKFQPAEYRQEMGIRQSVEHDQSLGGAMGLSRQGQAHTMAHSRRQSTEESIDSEDEWYQHEMTRLSRLEQEQKIKSGVERFGETGSGSADPRQMAAMEMERMRVQIPAHTKEPPDKPPDNRRDSKRFHRMQTSDCEEESSATGGADEDSATQSGADTVDEEAEDVGHHTSAGDSKQRPANLIIMSSDSQPKQSDRQLRPDLLQEVTAAAAQAIADEAYPDHLR